jgi:hypothetical protein
MSLMVVLLNMKIDAFIEHIPNAQLRVVEHVIELLAAWLDRGGLEGVLVPLQAPEAHYLRDSCF